MPDFLIEVRRETSRRLVPEARLKKTVIQILKELGWKRAAISLWLVGDRKMRQLNRKYFRHDRPTDVIAFSQLEGRPIKSRSRELPFLGDLIISLDTTVRQAKEYGNDYFYEFCFYVCHGALHLMGHSDETPKEAARMHQKQAAVLKKMRLWPSKKLKRSS